MRRVYSGLVILLSMLAAAAPARAEWRRAVSTHFVIYSEAGDADLREVAAKLERFDGVLRHLMPVPAGNAPAHRLTVYMPRTVGAIEQMLGGRGVGGFYNADIGGPFAVVPHSLLSDTFRSDVVLFHEYMHHFMLQHFSTAYPSWFVEGYAELFSNLLFGRDGSIVIGSFADHRGMTLRADPPPLRDLMFGARRVPPSRFYANAWALTHYLLISGERPGQLNRYIVLLGEGRRPEAAAQEAFGGIDALERDFRRYRAGRRIPTLILRLEQVPQPGPVTIESLSRGEESLLWNLVEYRTEPEGGFRDNLVRRVRARVAQMPDDPDALQLLADVEALAGNLAASGRAADAVLARRPDAPQALLRKGLVEIALLERDRVTDRARWQAAREWIRRANVAGPDNPRTLFEYYRAFERQGLRPPPPAVAALERAYELVPQSWELRQRFARELILARRYRFATDVLSPVAYSAHGGWRVEAAQRVIEAIRGLNDGAEPPAAALVVPERPAGTR